MGTKAYMKIRKNNSITLPDHCLPVLETKKKNQDNLILMWEGALDALVEYNVEELDDKEKLERYVMVAIWCIQEDPSLRPTMRRVTQMLEGVVEVLVPPGPILFW
uniref:Uncharacterized protein n=1 Tax=Quercus lobata TaxID=97700 RepID=A0A7N2QXE7_QUELO